MTDETKYMAFSLLPVREAPPARLETDRCVLTSIDEADIPELFERIVGDPEVMRFIGTGASPDLDHARARLYSLMNCERSSGLPWFVARRKDDGDLVGQCGLIPVERVGPEVEIGYQTARAYWRQGYTSEIARTVLRHGLDTLGLDRIIAICDLDNTGSWKVMEAIGMARIGVIDRYYNAECLVYEGLRLEG